MGVYTERRRKKLTIEHVMYVFIGRECFVGRVFWACGRPCGYWERMPYVLFRILLCFLCLRLAVHDVIREALGNIFTKPLLFLCLQGKKSKYTHPVWRSERLSHKAPISRAIFNSVDGLRRIMRSTMLKEYCFEKRHNKAHKSEKRNRIVR